MSSPESIYLRYSCPFCEAGNGVIITTLTDEGQYYTLACTSCDLSFDKEFDSVEAAARVWQKRSL